MLLTDCIQSQKVLTKEQTRDLIGKLEKLTDEQSRSRLQGQVHVDGRVKMEQTQLFRNVDVIRQAISDGRQIRFQYFQGNGFYYDDVSDTDIMKIAEACIRHGV
jgi:hypothetical protein